MFLAEGPLEERLAEEGLGEDSSRAVI